MVPHVFPASPPLRVTRRDPVALTPSELAAWRALARRSLEPSVFADPDMVLPMLQHRVPRRDAFVLLVWVRGSDGRERLCGALALRRERRLRLGRGGAWRSVLAACSTPLVAATDAVPVLTQMFADLAGPGGAPQVVFPGLPPGGALRSALDAAAIASGCAVVAQPPASPRPGPGSEAGDADAEATRAREAEPACTLQHRSDPEGVREGIERFLALEAATAKDCLLDDPVGATVFRVASRRLARRRLCRVSLALQGGTLVGAAVQLRGAGGDVVWRRAGRIAAGPLAAAAQSECRVQFGVEAREGLVRRLARRLRA